VLWIAYVTPKTKRRLHKFLKQSIKIATAETSDLRKFLLHCDLLFSPSVCPTASCALEEESMHSPFDLLEELLEAIAKTLADHPEEVKVWTVQGETMAILELRVHPEDSGPLTPVKRALELQTVDSSARWPCAGRTDTGDPPVKDYNERAGDLVSAIHSLRRSGMFP
jgi:hypothetical protein